jgi:beta-glucosidase
VTLTGDLVSAELSLESSLADWIGHPVVGPVLMQTMAAGLTEEQAQLAEENADLIKMVDSMPMGQFLSFTGLEVPAEALDQMMALSRSTPGQ